MPKGSGAPPAKVKVRVSLFGTLFCLLGFYYVTHALLGPAFSRALARLDWGVLLFRRFFWPWPGMSSPSGAVPCSVPLKAAHWPIAWAPP